MGPFLLRSAKRRSVWRPVRLAALSVVAVASCGPQRQDARVTADSLKDACGEALRHRAEQLWRARVQEDWPTVFSLQDPHEREGANEAVFAAWCQENEPFRVHTFRFGEVLTDRDLGWVEVYYRTSIRQFPQSPPRDARRWEKWRRVQGQWHPVPRQDLEFYPASPALRDLNEEARLLARFKESWAVRRERDWNRLYEMCDPQDRLSISEEEFAQVVSLFEYVSHRIQWVEVVGARGTVRVSYQNKVTDPSLSKLPPQFVTVNERWVRHDNEWYLDVQRP